MIQRCNVLADFAERNRSWADVTMLFVFEDPLLDLSDRACFRSPPISEPYIILGLLCNHIRVHVGLGPLENALGDLFQQLLTLVVNLNETLDARKEDVADLSVRRIHVVQSREFGHHLIKSRSATQATIAVPSAERVGFADEILRDPGAGGERGLLHA